MRLKRAVGWCSSDLCDEYAKGIFLMNHGPVYNCARCKRRGKLVPEHSKVKGEGKIFKEVRVHYDYDYITERYKALCIIKDEAIWEKGKTYHLYSPLIKTEKRGLKIAESLLGSLGDLGEVKDGDLILHKEDVLHWDHSLERYKQGLQRLEDKWAASRRSLTQQKG